MARPRAHDHAVVAELVRDAVTLGVSPADHVATTLGVSRDAAAQLIVRARTAGYAVPKVKEPPFRRRDSGLALRCTDCPATYPTDRVELLARHTHIEHGRPPRSTECTPRTTNPGAPA